MLYLVHLECVISHFYHNIRFICIFIARTDALCQVCLANIISLLRCVICMVLSSDQDDIVDRVSIVVF